MWLALLPEMGLIVLAGVVLTLDLIWRGSTRRMLGWVTAGGLLLIAILAVLFSRPAADPQLIFGGMLRLDGTAFVFRLIFLAGAALTALFMLDQEPEGQQGEFYALMLVSTLGMNLMAASADLIMLYLAIETTSLPLYVMAGFMTRDPKSTEAGIKYFLFGAMTAAVMLYGFSLLYGFSGTTSLYGIAGQLGQMPKAIVAVAAMLVLVGFGFKVSAVPFHFWAPDVYEGAPTPVAGFLSTASKAAGFAVLVRVLLVVFPAGQASATWTTVVAVISVASMTLGNALALAQKNIKRLLAYSSIAHAGYMLIGVAAISKLGITSVVFYMIAYLITNLAAFGIVATFWRLACTDDLTAYYGLSRRSPGLALAMLVAFLSLAGMPPFGGFVGKVFVFAAAINSGMVWLAIVGVLNSIIGLYYYLTVLKYVYLYPNEDNRPVPVPRPYAIALVVLIVGIIVVGTVIGPWFNWSTTAASNLF